MLRLSIARISGQIGAIEDAVQQYRRLLKQNVLIDEVADDLRDLVEDEEDPKLLQRLHRLLGDAYTKQGRISEAMDEYSWSYSTNRR